MSHIFDALQRSEAERSGVDLSALSAATEVLRRAELQRSRNRNVATRAENGRGAKPGRDESSAVRRARQPRLP